MLNVWISKVGIVVWEVGIELSGIGAVGKQSPVSVQIIAESEDAAGRPSEGAEIDKSVTGLMMRVVILCSDP